MSDGADGTPAIQVIDVTKVFDGGILHALDGVSMEVVRREFVAVTGPSGCGKSTLLHLIASLDHPTSGRIVVNGRDLRAAGNERFRRRDIGLVFQLHNLLPNLTSVENVEIAMFSNGQRHREQKARALELLEAVGLSAKQHTTPPRLSGGERQRLALARALANSPSIILADEPTGSLDSTSVTLVLDLLRDIRAREGVTILLVTHDANVARAADRIILMRDGRVVEASDAATPVTPQ
jgi:putative ABC transport system ATP-binding protein